MNRRSFLRCLSGVPLATLGSVGPAGALKLAQTPTGFALKYAPHFGMFRHLAGEDLIDQLRFMANQGFTALEDNGMKDRPVKDQQEIGKELDRLGMEMGVFVANASFGGVTFTSDAREAREQILKDLRDSVEVAARVKARWCTVVPGLFDPGLEWDYQTANVIDNLKYAAEIFEPHGLVMVLEPLNPWRDHPGLFLTKIPQAFMLCRSVNSPACKILFDIYHQQITEGNLIPNMERAWDEIAYFQVGDNPGRKEPTTGEINYKNVFKYIHSRGFRGIIGMEHGNFREGAEGERAVIESYRAVDPD